MRNQDSMKQSFEVGKKVNLLEKWIILLGDADYAHEVDNYEFSDIILPGFLIFSSNSQLHRSALRVENMLQGHRAKKQHPKSYTEWGWQRHDH